MRKSSNSILSNDYDYFLLSGCQKASSAVIENTVKTFDDIFGNMVQQMIKGRQ